jgi:hypothetical protein
MPAFLIVEEEAPCRRCNFTSQVDPKAVNTITATEPSSEKSRFSKLRNGAIRFKTKLKCQRSTRSMRRPHYSCTEVAAAYRNTKTETRQKLFSLAGNSRAPVRSRVSAQYYMLRWLGAFPEVEAHLRKPTLHASNMLCAMKSQRQLRCWSRNF